MAGTARRAYRLPLRRIDCHPACQHYDASGLCPCRRPRSGVVAGMCPGIAAHCPSLAAHCTLMFLSTAFSLRLKARSAVRAAYPVRSRGGPRMEGCRLAPALRTSRSVFPSPPSTESSVCRWEARQEAPLSVAGRHRRRGLAFDCRIPSSGHRICARGHGGRIRPNPSKNYLYAVKSICPLFNLLGVFLPGDHRWRQLGRRRQYALRALCSCSRRVGGGSRTLRFRVNGNARAAALTGGEVGAVVLLAQRLELAGSAAFTRGQNLEVRRPM